MTAAPRDAAATRGAASGARRGTCALLALLLATAAQVLLESGGRVWTVTTPGYLPVFIFAAASALAIAAVEGRRDRWPGARPLRLAIPTWPWFLACVPGICCLAVATAVIGPETPSRTTFTWWSVGILLLLAVGTLHAAQTRKTRPARPADDWSRPRLALAVGLLVGVAVAMRTALGVDNLPAFVEGDEAWVWSQAGYVFQVDPFDWFRTYWVGVPVISLIPMRIVQMFGTSLRAARMGSVTLGTVSVVATFAAGRRLLGNWPALVGALLLAAAHTHVHWSRTVQPYIQSPTAAALFIWLLVRVWNGGSMLAWVGAALALGIGTQTYQASQLFPALFLFTVLGWGVIERPGWQALALSTLFVGLIAALLMGPTVRTALTVPELVASRPATLFLFSHANLERLGDDRAGQIADHALRTVAMFNSGSDFLANYGAERPLVDAVTGALVPLAAALLLARLRNSAAWLCTLWWFTYVFVTVFLANHPPSYHRVPTALVFVALAVGSAWTQLMAVMCDGFRLGAWSVPAGSLGIAAVATIANADFYFRQYPTVRGVQHTLGLARIVCPYVASHVVLDATYLDGYEYVALDNPARRVLCHRWDDPTIHIQHVAELWDIDRFTQGEDVVLIVPQVVLQAHPGQPHGYRIVRQYVDENIRHPVPLPLAVFELRRASAP